MTETEYELRIEDVKARAHGRWDEILRCLGVDERILKHKNLPCPLCGGTDRFQYTDRYGEGNYHCRNRDSCGPGGGFKLLQALKGWDFVTTLKKVNECVGGLPAATASRPPPISRTSPSMARVSRWRCTMSRLAPTRRCTALSDGGMTGQYDAECLDRRSPMSESPAGRQGMAAPLLGLERDD